jgi:hypothetical protein
LLGKDFKVSQRRGELIASSLAPHVMATIHPRFSARRMTKPAAPSTPASSANCGESRK